MNNTITKIRDVSSSNYGDRQGHSISHIVIGMSNNTHSGYAYAKSYRQQLSPRISYNYVIDKLGNIYQTIDNQYAPFTINPSNSNRQIENQECVSICFMPEWDGSSLVDDYDSGYPFPTNPETNQVFLLTKAIKKNGITYPMGLYHYSGTEWILDERLSSDDIKRPYESEDWSITEETEGALLALTKWLQTKYSVSNANILRIYDYYKSYNPAPYIINENEQWAMFKELLSETDYEQFSIIPESSPSGEDISATDEDRRIAELIEQYGPDAGIDIDNTFRASNSASGSDLLPGNKYQFELGIHDILETSIIQETNESGELVNKTNTAGNLWHIANSTRTVTWKTYLQDNCDELNFEFMNKDFNIKLEEGFSVGYWLNNIGGFCGNIFKLSQNSDNKELITATAYGYLRYLKCDSWTSFENMTASQIFSKACTIANIPHRIIDNSTYICKPKTCYGKTLYDTVQEAIMETLVHEKKWYVIQPFFDLTGGGIQFIDILNAQNIRQIKFSEDSAILKWDFDSSIDESANIIMTFSEGSSGNATATGAMQDTSTIKKWGRLSKVIQDGEMESGGLTLSADQWLKFYNSPRRRIKLECLGIPEVKAGNIIYLEIYNVVSVGDIKGCLIVDDCTHKIDSDKYTMELNCEIVQDGTVREIIYNSWNNNQVQNDELKQASQKIVRV